MLFQRPLDIRFQVNGASRPDGDFIVILHPLQQIIGIENLGADRRAAIQGREATYLWWGKPANKPISSVYGGHMVHVPECAAWTWDARPYPFFPTLTDVWTDGANWRLGHWLIGRPGAVSLAALVRHLCLRAGLAEYQAVRHLRQPRPPSRPFHRGRTGER